PSRPGGGDRLDRGVRRPRARGACGARPGDRSPPAPREIPGHGAHVGVTSAPTAPFFARSPQISLCFPRESLKARFLKAALISPKSLPSLAFAAGEWRGDSQSDTVPPSLSARSIGGLSPRAVGLFRTAIDGGRLGEALPSGGVGGGTSALCGAPPRVP